MSAMESFAQADAAVKDVQAKAFKLARKQNKTESDYAKLGKLHLLEDKLSNARDKIRWELESEVVLA